MIESTIGIVRHNSGSSEAEREGFEATQIDRPLEAIHVALPKVEGLTA